MTHHDVAIVGAGITGISCAAMLKEAGLKPIVLDKGRGIGGRLATRRTETGLQFDHGAQYITAKTDSFQKIIADLEKLSAAKRWAFGHKDCWVGLPGMSGFAKQLASGLTISLNTLVTGLRETQSGCDYEVNGEQHTASRIVVTIPAPQALAFFDPQHAFYTELASVRLEPCLTLMAAFEPDLQIPFTAERDLQHSLSWIAHDSSKPGRTTRNCYIAQASPDWSKKNLELDPVSIAEKMLPLLCKRLSVDPARVTHAVAHRWRYAAVSQPLGRDFMRNQQGTIYLGGDWCLDARVEAAWQSGVAIASDILKD